MINVDKNLIKELLPSRPYNSNKGDFGKVLCITGSNTYIGAGILSALSVLRVGAGYSILCSEEEAIEHYKNYSADLIYKTHKHFDFEIVKDIIDSLNINTVVLGCGIGNNDMTLKFTAQAVNFFLDNNIKTVLDADALNCLAKLDLKLNENFIITPHPKELSRLLKVDVNDILTDREKYLTIACEKYYTNVILKGYNTLIGNKNSKYQNITGNNVLAKSGTGDVLAGMIAGFIAQNAEPIVAGILATYLHGLAGEIYSKKYSQYSMLASDLLTFIQLAIKEILNE